ncbi:metabolite traffic protein EboE [Blastococcus capsensis]|uniref:metabolite traffic protein EboE n=1 Tax=Blastococcus capsensis TaxID=1564163 RepID=UPI002541FD67|nr:metabolite traffic protein EboE [Blastococcus capsensis]MDK3256798.1 metabolite traffic protein EboE [Blastococcus capsensis]
MRLSRAGDGPIHLGYCTNVHPAEDVAGIVDQLRRLAAGVRAELTWPRLGVGLWLPRTAATELADPAACARLREVLDELGLEVVTLNGFPYQGFQEEVVKHRVYRPDWTEDARVTWTLDLARILARLLPDDVATGSISTLPLGWREPWDDAADVAAIANLRAVGDALAALEEETGKRILLAIEPEPGCRVETTAEAAAVAERVGRPHVGICVDLCHLAVEFEDPVAAIAALQERGTLVAKVQVSSALRAEDPDDPAVRAALAGFDEARFLHQTRAGGDGGIRARADDLGEALAGAVPVDAEWRVHFHAPLQAAALPPLGTTRSELETALQQLVGPGRVLTRHLELETYTWTVLPPDRRPAGDDSLVSALAEELRYVAGRLRSLGWTKEEE